MDLKNKAYKKLTLVMVSNSWTLSKWPASNAPKTIKLSFQVTMQTGDPLTISGAGGQMLR